MNYKSMIKALNYFYKVARYWAFILVQGIVTIALFAISAPHLNIWNEVLFDNLFIGIGLLILETLIVAFLFRIALGEERYRWLVACSYK